MPPVAVNPASPPDQARGAALFLLGKAEAGAPVDTLLEQTRQRFDSRDNAFILELLYGVLRNRSWLDLILNRFSSKPIATTDAWTRNILRLGLYQILFLDRVPVSAAVNTSVQLAKKHGGKQGYVNGLLRTIERNRAGLAAVSLTDPVERLSVRYSHPAWLVRRWFDRFGPDRTESLLQANNLPSPLTIRTNVLRTDREQLRTSLASEGCEAEESRFSPAGLHLRSIPRGIRNLGSYQRGWFLIQDEAAQLVGTIAAPRKGGTVLEACAAPGGKATHLAELMEDRGRILALDIDKNRIAKIRENTRRLGITMIDTVEADATAFRAGPFDLVLIDAPCSGLGVLRRHPDGRWTKSQASIADYAELQKRILSNCAEMVKPGGALVYSTCTTEPEENEEVIAWFLSQGSGFMLDDPRRFLPAAASHLVDSSLYFRTFPAEPLLDGFFCARLKKIV